MILKFISNIVCWNSLCLKAAFEIKMNPDTDLDKVLEVVVKNKKLINDHTPSVDIIDLDFFQGRYILD